MFCQRGRKNKSYLVTIEVSYNKIRQFRFFISTLKLIYTTVNIIKLEKETSRSK